jgi:hypothetical protein
MAIRVEPSEFDISQYHKDSIDILHQVNWIQFLLKFDGYDEQVTKSFAHNFDGKKTIVGYLTFQVTED